MQSDTSAQLSTNNGYTEIRVPICIMQSSYHNTVARKLYLIYNSMYIPIILSYHNTVARQLYLMYKTMACISRLWQLSSVTRAPSLAEPSTPCCPLHDLTKYTHAQTKRQYGQDGPGFRVQSAPSTQKMPVMELYQQKQL